MAHSERRVVRSRVLCMLVLTLPVIPQTTMGQYWGDRVLEKSFEQMDMFFVPASLNPYGLGVFRNSTAGILRDPLLELTVNPALVKLDSSQAAWCYTDFRSARNVTGEEAHVYPAYMDMAIRSSSYYAPFPWIYRNTRRELEPVFSGAFILRPMPETAPELHAGVAYQLTLQDDRYYTIPQDIYRSAAGYDYNGMRVAGAESYTINDVTSGTDHIHHSGQSITAFGRYVLPQGLAVGARASRVIFDREGALGSSNTWDRYSAGGSFWANRESRTQNYGHWDVGGGFECTARNGLQFGAMGGYLWGDVDQRQTNMDSSHYAYSSVTNSNYYVRSGNRTLDWRHKGKTWYLGADATVAVSSSSSFRLTYQHQHSSADITLGASILDTSFSAYNYMNDTVPVSSLSRSSLSDMRSGTGSSKTEMNRALACVRLGIDRNVSISIGALVEWRTVETDTRETVAASDGYFSSSTYNTYSWINSRIESKDLCWSFRARRTSFQIPMFVTIRPSEKVEVLLGLNREMVEWRIDDETLALYRYRTVTENQSTTTKLNFGERTVEPQESVSDVRTTFMAGITVGTQGLKFRALMVPVFKDSYDGPEMEQIQWWLSMSLSL